MPKNVSSALQTGPLSVGDVINGGIRIYRDHFKSYLGLAFIAYLWLLVPVYGWAKFSATLGLLSRLAFGEVSEHPETVGDVRSEVNPRMWSFLGAGIVTSLIYLGVSVAGGIAIGILAATASAISGQNYLIIGVVVTVAVIAFFVLYLRVISQLFIVELPLAIRLAPSAHLAPLSPNYRGVTVAAALVFRRAAISRCDPPGGQIKSVGAVGVHTSGASVRSKCAGRVRLRSGGFGGAD